MANTQAYKVNTRLARLSPKDKVQRDQLQDLCGAMVEQASTSHHEKKGKGWAKGLTWKKKVVYY